MEGLLSSLELEKEVLTSMEPFVKKQLRYLQTDAKAWWPSDFLGFMELPDDQCFKQLKTLREEARALSNEELAVLLGDIITEEALPLYSMFLIGLFPDDEGTSSNPWNVWTRGWTAEENVHGDLLNRYLFLTGRVDQREVDKSTASLITNGMDYQKSAYKGMFYTSFQELATAISHRNMAKRAQDRGVESLFKMCNNIAKDETRHGVFYKKIASEIMRIEPEKAIIEYAKLMKSSVVMPAARMVDGIHTEPPTLFNHFARVAEKIKVYTAFDYMNIIKDLNNAFDIAHVNVTGEADEARTYLCDLPKKIEKIATRKELRDYYTPVAFGWIHGELA